MNSQLNFIDIFKKRKQNKFSAKSNDLHDGRVLYKTKHKEADKHNLYVRIGDRAMKKAGLTAGDRVVPLRSPDYPTVIGLRKDDSGAKLCPQGLTGDEYHDAIKKNVTMNCTLNVTIYKSDRLPYTHGNPVRAKWSKSSDGLLVIDLPDDEVAISHIIETDTKAEHNDTAE